MDLITGGNPLANAFVQSIPFVNIALGMGLFFFMLCGALVVSLAIIIALDVTSESPNGMQQMTNSLGLLLPGISWLASYIGTLLQNIARTLPALAQVFRDKILTLITLVALALGVAVFLDNQSEIYGIIAEFEQCAPFTDFVWGFVFSIANFLSLVYAVGIPFWNIIRSLQFLIFNLWERVLIQCGVDDWQSLGVFVQDLGLGVELLGEAIFNFTSAGVLDGRLELVSTVTAITSSLDDLMPILNCSCSFFDFLFLDVFRVVQDPSLAVAIDCAANTPIAFIQDFVHAVEELKFPQIENATIEAACFTYAGMDWIHTASIAIVEIGMSFINLLPINIASDPALSAVVYGPSSASYYYGASVSVPEAYFAVADLGPPTMFGSKELGNGIVPMLNSSSIGQFQISGINNLSNINWTQVLINLVTLQYVLQLVETQWQLGVSETIVGVLFFVNGTWSVSRLLTEANGQFDMIQYFQVGYIFDRLRAGAYGFGDLLSVFDVNAPYVAADLLIVAYNIIQAVLELIVDGVFINVFTPSPNPFDYWVPYYDDPTHVPQMTVAVLYNHSAALAGVLGCSPMPTSPTQACSNNPIACIIFSVENAAIGLFSSLQQMLFYLNELVQFNSNLKTFGNISMNPMFFSLIQLGTCLKQFIYLFDIPGFGVPPDEPCEYTQPGGTTGFKISFFCSLGRLVNSILLTGLAVVYELLDLVRTLAASFATPIPVPPVTIAVPTLADAIEDLRVDLCNLGQVVGGIMPVSFQCGNNGNPSGGPLNGPTPPQLSFQNNVPVVPSTISERSTTRFSRTRAQWSAAFLDNSTCNCSLIPWSEIAWQNTSSNLHCLIQCRPAYAMELPVHIGSAVEDFILDYIVYFQMGQWFTQYCALGAGYAEYTTEQTLGLLLADNTPITGGPYQLPVTTDVIPNLAGTVGSEALVAWLNVHYNSLLNPKENLFFSDSLDPSCTIFTTTHGVGATLRPAFAGVSVRAVVYYYLRVSLLFFSVPGVVCLFGNETATPLYRTPIDFSDIYYSEAAGAFPLVGIPNLWPDVLEILENFNAYFVNGVSTPITFLGNPGCFWNQGQPDLPDPFLSTPPPPAPPVTAPNSTAVLPFYPNVTACTYTLNQFAPPGPPSCTCSQDYPYVPTSSGGNPYCLWVCNLGPHMAPTFEGLRADDCPQEGLCWAASYIPYATLNDWWLNMNTYPDGSGLIGALNQGRNLPGNNQAQEFGSQLQALRMNAALVQNRTGGNLFVRPLNDPQLVGCFPDGWIMLNIAGQRFDILANVFETLLLGILQPLPQCIRYFPIDSQEYQICIGFVSNFVTGTTYQYNWNFQLAPNLTLIMRQMNSARQDCSAEASAAAHCFIFSTDQTQNHLIALPGPSFIDFGGLNFIPPEAGTFPIPTILSVGPCQTGTTQCFSAAFCDAANLVLIPFELLSNILTNIRNAVNNPGSGQWNYGLQLPAMIKNVLSSVVIRSGVFVLAIASLLDCILCAIKGNNPNDPLCQFPIYEFLRPFAIFVNDVGTLLIGFTVDVVFLLIAFIRDFFTGHIVEAITDIWNIIVKFFTSLVPGLVNVVFGFIFSFLGFCDDFNTAFHTSLKCVNINTPGGVAKLQPGKKRDLVDPGAASSLVLTEPDGSTPLYQIIDPAFPENSLVAWPATDECNTSVPPLALLLEATGQASSLTPEEEHMVSFCLGRVLTFGGRTQPAPASAAAALDQCDTMMTSLNARGANWSSLDDNTRASAIKCLGERAVVKHLKDRSTGGLISWVPDNLLSVSSGAMGIVGTLLTTPHLVFNFLDAVTISEARDRDFGYDPAVLQDSAYLAAANASYGAARVDVITAVANGTLDFNTSVDAYVASMISDPARRPMVSSMVTTLDALRVGARTILPGMLISAINTHVSTMAPPLNLTNSNTSTPVSAATEASFGLLSAAQQRDIFFQERQNTVHRMINAGWQIFKLVTGIGMPPSNTTTETLAASGTLFASSSNATQNRTKVSLPYAFYTALNALVQIPGELISGRALRNATLTIAGAEPTVLPWQLNPRYTPVGIANFVQNTALTTLFGYMQRNILQRVTVLLRFFGQQQQALQTSSLGQQVAARRLQRAWNDLRTATRFNTDSSSPSFRIASAAQCLTNLSICQQCLYLDNFVGNLMNMGQVFVETLSGNGAPNFQATLPYMYTKFNARLAYMKERAGFVQVGGNTNISVRWPYPNVSAWSVLSDSGVGEIGFTDIEPLLNATWNLILKWIGPNGTLRGLDEIDFNFLGASSVGSDPPRPQVASRPADLRVPLVGPTTQGVSDYRAVINSIAKMGSFLWNGGKASSTPAPGVALYSSSSSAIRIAEADNFTTPEQIAEGWFIFIFENFLSCSFTSELNGAAKRFPLAQVLVVWAAIIVGFFILVGSAFPAVLILITSSIPLLSIAISTALLGLVLCFTYSWSLQCAPALPYQLADDIMDAVIYNFWPKAPVWMGGVILQPAFGVIVNGVPSNNVSACELWQRPNNTFVFGSCINDFGWRALSDPVIFPIRFFWPDGLRLLTDPNNFPFPFDVIIASSAFQERITRWNNVDLAGDPIVYSGNLHCWVVMTVAFLIYFTIFTILVGFALSAGIIQNVIGILSALLIASVLFFAASILLLFQVLMYGGRLSDDEIDRRIAESEEEAKRNLAATLPPAQLAQLAKYMLVPLDWFEQDLELASSLPATEYELRDIYADRGVFARY